MGDYETSLVFRKSKYFWKFINRQMLIYDAEHLNDTQYKLLLFSSMPVDFNDAIDENTGCLISNEDLVEITQGFTNASFDLRVDWIDDGENGFTLSVDNDGEDVQIMISDDVSFYVRGVALVKEYGSEDNNANFVVAYSTLSTSIKCQNAITIADGSEFVGHRSCRSV